MLDQVFDSMNKAAAATVEMQQDLFKKWMTLWPGAKFPPTPFGEPAKIQKKWAEIVGETIKKERETLEAQFSVGLRNIEEAFRLAEAKDPEELRVKAVDLWQKTFECLRQTFEAQVRGFQEAATKWTEVMFKGAA